MGNELVGVRARHGAPVGRWAMMRRYLPTGSRGGATFIDASRAVGDLESICTNGLQGGAAVAEEVVTGEGTRGAGGSHKMEAFFPPRASRARLRSTR